MNIPAAAAKDIEEEDALALVCMCCKRAFEIDSARVMSEASLPPAALAEHQRRKRGQQSNNKTGCYRTAREIPNDISPFRPPGHRSEPIRTSNMPPVLCTHYQWSALCPTAPVGAFRTVQVGELCDDASCETRPVLSLPKTVCRKEPVKELVYALLEETSRKTLLDLSLCCKCWKESLQAGQKAVDRLTEEIDILVSLADVDDESLALCVSADPASLLDVEATSAMEQSLAVDAELEQLRQTLQLLEKTELETKRQEESSFRRLAAARYHVSVTLDGEDAVRMATEHLSARQKKLDSVLLLAEFFIISTSGAFGTINRLRLGRIAPSGETTEFPVTITEVNCACGYLLHLLSYLCHTNKVLLTNAILRPSGDCSKIEIVSVGGKKGEVLDFFITDKFFKWKTFGPACVAFAQCTKELVSAIQADLLSRSQAHCDNASSTTVTFPPHLIDGERIGGFSVKSGDTSDDNWIKGMKCLLGVLEWCIASRRQN